MCVSRDNVRLYLMFLFSMMGIHGSFIYMIYNIVSINSGEEYIYTSDSYLNNFVLFLTSAGVWYLILFFINLLCLVIYWQVSLPIMMCMGYGITYYNAYRQHKRFTTEVVKRQPNSYVANPHYLVTLSTFIKNLIRT